METGSTQGVCGSIGATLYVTMVTCHHHFFKVEFAIFQAILSFTRTTYKIPIFPYTLGKRIVFFLLPEAFCGRKYAENAIATGPRWGSSRRSPRLPSRPGSGRPSPYPTPLGASIVVPPDTKSWRRHWSPPLLKVKLRQCVVP